jgi:hypothetical protein
LPGLAWAILPDLNLPGSLGWQACIT